MKPPAANPFTVRKLWEHCDRREFAIPEIQREFVWDARRAGSLLDSIYKGLPIGTLVIWETHRANRLQLRHAQHALPPYNPACKHIWFLLDGQQRLSVLYRAKAGGVVRSADGREIDFSKLCFSFDDRYDSRFLLVKRPAPKLHIPMIDILSSRWRRRLAYLPSKKLNEIAKMRSMLMNYRIPVQKVTTNNLGEVREAFLRINSGGLRISKADRAFSKASRLNLRELVTRLRDGLPHGFSKIDNRLIQALLPLIAGQISIASQAIENAISRLEKEELPGAKATHKFTKEWGKIEKAVTKAVDYLTTELKVLNFSFLPSENMMTLLAFFFYQNESRQPSTVQRRELRKWFWATAIGRRYIGRGYFQNIRDDVDFFTRLARRGTGRFRFNDVVPKSDLRNTDYRVGASLAKGFFLNLLLREPRYLESGSRMPVDRTASVSNRKDKHHIFPRAALRGHGFSAREMNSVCNMCFIVAEENQSIGGAKPHLYLAPFRRKIHLARVMKSHVIPYDKSSGLWDANVRRGYRTFLARRTDAICEALEKEAGIRLFRKE